MPSTDAEPAGVAAAASLPVPQSRSSRPSSLSEAADNPCWGGPELERHDLRYLLAQIEAGTFGAVVDTSTRSDAVTDSSGSDSDRYRRQYTPIVLHSDENYIAISKPPDLRMDGPHPATVHKLLTYWFPPPSLQSACDEGSDSSASAFNPILAERVSKLAKHSDLADNALRPVHQLDYATSGVLLVARTRKAARVACKAFEDRSTKKEYVALVAGHINISDGANKVPTLPKDALRGWSDGSTEREYRKKRNDINKATFAGYMPTHSVFAKWKGRIIRQSKNKNNHGEGRDDGVFPQEGSSRRKRSRPNGFEQSPDIECAQAVDPDSMLYPRVPFTTEEENTLLSMKWKDVKKIDDHAKVFDDMAKRYNATLSNQQLAMKKDVTDDTMGSGALAKEHAPQSSNHTQKLPAIFQIEGEDSDSFYIQAPLADVTGHFRVYLQTSSIPATHPCRDYYSSVPKDGRELDFKPSLTRVLVLKRGEYDGSPVTKVLLQPRTGRRHQLRLHLALMNHPILGDVTYTPPNAMISPDCCRMCLHSLKLTLPLIGGEIKTFVAPDPFKTFSSEGADGVDDLIGLSSAVA